MHVYPLPYLSLCCSLVCVVRLSEVSGTVLNQYILWYDA